MSWLPALASASRPSIVCSTRKSPRGRPPSRGYRIMQKIFLRSNRWLALTDAPANACWSKRSSICGTGRQMGLTACSGYCTWSARSDARPHRGQVAEDATADAPLIRRRTPPYLTAQPLVSLGCSMRQELAEGLLGQVMNWERARLAEELPLLDRMARFKYDEYQHFAPGRKFVESLGLWLNQFEVSGGARGRVRFREEPARVCLGSGDAPSCRGRLP